MPESYADGAYVSLLQSTKPAVRRLLTWSNWPQWGHAGRAGRLREQAGPAL